MKKLLLLLIKFVPAILLAGTLIKDTIYCFGICNKLYNILNFLISNSFIVILLIYVCSYTFNFCVWHRLLIIANFINLIIANINVALHINLTNVELLYTNYIVAFIFILLSILSKIYQRNERQTIYCFTKYS